MASGHEARLGEAKRRMLDQAGYEFVAEAPLQHKYVSRDAMKEFTERAAEVLEEDELREAIEVPLPETSCSHGTRRVDSSSFLSNRCRATEFAWSSKARDRLESPPISLHAVAARASRPSSFYSGSRSPSRRSDTATDGSLEAGTPRRYARPPVGACRFRGVRLADALLVHERRDSRLSHAARLPGPRARRPIQWASGPICTSLFPRVEGGPVDVGHTRGG